MAELFGPRVFRFSVGPKYHQKWRFCGDLKKNFNMIFRVMSRKFRVIPWDRPFSGRTKVFPAILILQMMSPSRNYEPSKNEHLFRVLQKVAATKQFFCRNVENCKNKIFGLTEFFVKYF